MLFSWILQYLYRIELQRVTMTTRQLQTKLGAAIFAAILLHYLSTPLYFNVAYSTKNKDSKKFYITSTIFDTIKYMYRCWICCWGSSLKKSRSLLVLQRWSWIWRGIQKNCKSSIFWASNSLRSSSLLFGLEVSCLLGEGSDPLAVELPHQAVSRCIPLLKEGHTLIFVDIDEWKENKTTGKLVGRWEEGKSRLAEDL